MRRISIVLILALVPLSCIQRDVDERLAIDVESIVIDVRTEREFKAGHLNSAINIPHTEIRERINDYTKDKEQEIIVYCRSGKRAGIAKGILQELGYKNVKNAGEYETLKKQKRDGA